MMMLCWSGDVEVNGTAMPPEALKVMKAAGPRT